MSNPNKTTDIYSPLRLLLIVIVATFMVETLIMFILPFLPPFPNLGHALLDSILLVTLSFPVVYFFSFRPMVRHIAKRKHAEAVLQKTLDELEIRVEERTKNLAKTNQELQLEISERKRAVEALQRSESRLANILENAAEAIIAVDANQNIILFNKGAEKIFCYQEAEVLGQPLDILLPEMLAETHRRQIQIFGAAGQTSRPMGVRQEVSGRRKDGAEFPAQVGISTHVESGQMIFTAVLIDITERKAAENRIRSEAARAEALTRVADRLNAQLDLDTVLRAVCEEVAFALNVSRVSTTLYDETGGQMVPAAGFGWSEEIFRSLQQVPGSNFDFPLRRNDPATYFEDVQKISDFPNVDLFKQEDIHTILNVSMLREGNLIGGINVFVTGHIRKFEKDEISLVKGIANEAAQAITNARLYQETCDRASQLSLLYEMGLALNSMLEPHSQLEFLFKIARDTLNADQAAFYRFNKAKDELQLELNIGYPEKSINNMSSISVEDQCNPVGWVASNLLPLNIPNVQADSEFLPLVSDTHSLLLVPVIRNGRLLGVLSVARTQPRPFSLQDERLLLLFANQAAVAMENARLFLNAERRLSQVKALHSIDLAITEGFDLKATIGVILEKVVSELHVDAANLFIYDPTAERLDFVDSRGFCSQALQHTHLLLGEGYAGQAALERRMVYIPDLNVQPDGLARSLHLPGEGFTTYFAVPLMAKDEVKGVLEIFHGSNLVQDSEWLSFLEALAGQTAIAIDNFNLVNNLRTANLELTQSYDETIEGWSRALDLRDKETEGHTQRVTEMTLRLARAMGVREDELLHVRRGAILHDIGKMGIPDNILLKPGPLADEEWIIMRKHPVYACEMLEPIGYLRLAIDIPYCHHEKWDGTGYPRGLKDEEIPVVARIFAVVDVWDAITSDRPYRPAWPYDKALSYIREQSGKHFDPCVVTMFLKFIDDNNLF